MCGTYSELKTGLLAGIASTKGAITCLLLWLRRRERMVQPTIQTVSHSDQLAMRRGIPTILTLFGRYDVMLEVITIDPLIPSSMNFLATVCAQKYAPNTW